MPMRKPTPTHTLSYRHTYSPLDNWLKESRCFGGYVSVNIPYSPTVNCYSKAKKEIKRNLSRNRVQFYFSLSLFLLSLPLSLSPFSIVAILVNSFSEYISDDLRMLVRQISLAIVDFGHRRLRSQFWKFWRQKRKFHTQLAWWSSDCQRFDRVEVIYGMCVSVKGDVCGCRFSLCLFSDL